MIDNLFKIKRDYSIRLKLKETVQFVYFKGITLNFALHLSVFNFFI